MTTAFEEALSLAGFHEPQWTGNKSDLLKLFNATRQLMLAEPEAAYLITLQRPGRRTVYASIDAQERHDDTTDAEWESRKVEPLFTKDAP